jgi:CMP-N-acetylneuraminic acid synthetase
MPVIDALIPARGGSKGLPRKNVRPLAGKPLICYSIEAALRSRCIRGCFVSTEDPEISSIASACGATVIERPLALAGDETSSEDVCLHALDALASRSGTPDYFVLLQPTSPLRTHHHIDDCIGALLASATLSAMSVTVAEHHPFKCLRVQDGLLQPLFDADKLHAARQKLPVVYRQNGAIYVCPVPDFLARRTFFLPPVLPFVMNAEDSIDIDSAHDLDCAEAVCARRLPATR